MDPAQISGVSIARRLAACDAIARNRAVRLFCRWLPLQSSDAVAENDLIKVWKGLFYCVWHADKLPFQLDLINRLSSLLETIDSELSSRYFEAFLITIRREWSGIDFLRLDKFYLLIRKFIHRLFALLKKNNWDLGFSNRLVGVLSEKSLLSTDKFQASGVNYHISEVFLEEIDGFLPIKPELFDLLLMPFVRVLEKTADRVLVNKIKCNVFEKLLENGLKYLNGERNEQVEKFGKVGFVLEFSEKFFKSASDSETVQGNRKVLFELHQRFLKLEKDFKKSGLDVSLEQLGNGHKAEKVEFFVMETANGDGELNVRQLKKRKKEKKTSDGVEKKSKSKKKNIMSTDSAIDCNGKIENVGNGDTNVDNNAEIVGGANGAEIKSKKESKKKKKKKNSPNSAGESNGENGDAAVEEKVNGGLSANGDLLEFNESVVSNLQKQFEKAAAEAGLASPKTPIGSIGTAKKRKRVKSADKLKSTDKKDTASKGESTAVKSGEKSMKKVRFSMKNNLVWKPHSPMPPQDLRLPPSATPRGSALKKGVLPGPIKESPPTAKMIRAKGSSVKRARRVLKTVSPVVKRLRKSQM